MSFKWTSNKSGRIWNYVDSEFGIRGTVVKEKENEYHTYGISDSWGIFKTLGAAKKKVKANIGT